MQQDKEFKVGDVVRMNSIAKTKWEHSNLNPHDLTGKVITIYGSGRVQVRWSNNQTNAYSIKEIELIEPKQEQYYTSIPTDVKEGDRFVVVSNIRLEGDVYNFPFYGIDIGSIVTLSEYHKSRFSKFTNEQGEIWEYNWGWLKPVKVDTNSHLADVSPTVLFGKDSLGNTDIQKFEVGDEVEVTNSNYPVIMYVSNGTIGKIITIEGSGILVQFDKCRQLCKATQLKLINKTNHNYGKVQNSMSFSTTSLQITRGETICSSAIRCSKSKIQI